MAAPIVGILGQAAPAADTLTTLYTVPAARQAVVSTLVVAETGGAATTIRIHICKNAAAGGTANAIAYDLALSANTHYGFTEGLTLAANDIVRVQSASGSVTFTLFGEETDVPAS